MRIAKAYEVGRFTGSHSRDRIFVLEVGQLATNCYLYVSQGQVLVMNPKGRRGPGGPVHLQLTKMSV